jgi:hypothetical protein
MGNNRSQLAFIRSKTFEFAGIEMREIVSAGLKSMGPFDARTANILLKQNAQAKLGCWGVQEDSKGNHVAVFCANVSANLSGQTLLAAIQAVLVTADQMEERLSGGDDF